MLIYADCAGDGMAAVNRKATGRAPGTEKPPGGMAAVARDPDPAAKEAAQASPETPGHGTTWIF